MSSRGARSRNKSLKAEKVEEISKNTETTDAADTETPVVKATTRVSTRLSQRIQTKAVEETDENGSSDNDANGESKSSADDDDIEHKDDEFMRSEHFPKICSRVGAKYQAHVPSFNDGEENSGGGEAGDPTAVVTNCVWSPVKCCAAHENSLLSDGASACETMGNDRAGSSSVILERYLAQAKLIMCQFYQSQLNSNHHHGGANILGGLSPRLTGENGSGAAQKDGESGSDVDGENGAASEDVCSDDCRVAERKKRNQKGSSRKRVKDKDRDRDRAVRGGGAVLDGSFFMISSCVEDVLLELLHRR